MPPSGHHRFYGLISLVSGVLLTLASPGSSAHASAEVTFESLDPSRSLHHYGYTNWTTADGLPSNTIRDIAQTPDGYLWLATNAGLARFDGVRFRNFDSLNSPGLATDFLTELCLTRDGTLWVGSNAGLIRYRDGTFRTLGRDQGLSADSVDFLFEDPDGVLWVIAGGEAHRLRGERLAVVERPEQLADRWINSVVEGPDDGLWFTTSTDGLLEWSAGEWAVPALEDSILLRELTFAIRTRDGGLWLAGPSSEPWWLARHQGGSTVGFRRLPPASSRIRAIHEARDGTLWLASGGALFRIRSDRMESFVPDSPDADRRFVAVFEDREGNVWSSTYGGGLHRLSNGPITFFNQVDGLEGTALAIHEDRNRQLWVGGAGGLFRYDGRRFVAIEEVPEEVRSIAEGQDGELWLGADRALVRYRDGESERYPTDGLVLVVFVDRGETVYASILDRGLARFTGAGFEILEQLQTPFVRWVEESPPGVLWVGSQHDGLARCQAGDCSWMTTASGLSSDSLLAHHRDASGALWLGTEGRGLNRLEGDSITAYTREQGLHDNNIWPILEDDLGNLWMGGDRGIFSIGKQQFADLDAGRIDSLTPRTFGQADGLKSGEGAGMGEPSGFKTRDGRLWFAMAGGVAMVNPERLSSGPAPPPVKIEKALVGDQEIEDGAGVEVPPLSKNLEFRFTAMSLINSREIQFQYRLEGHEDGWRDAGTRRQALYSALPPGSYRFQLRARRPHGKWSAEAAVLPVYVLPAWWQTWWFRVMAGLIAIGLLAVVSTLSRSSALRRSRELERQVAEREESERVLQEMLSERERARLALERSEARSRATLDSLSAPVVVLAPDGTIVRVNDTWRRFGAENGADHELIEGVGLNYLEVCRTAKGDGGEDAEQALAGFEAVLAGRAESFDMEYPCHSPTHKRWFLLRAVPLGSAEGGLVVSHIDVTERKRAALELAESDSRQRQQREELAHVQRVAAMGELVGAISHEINQPLTAIRSNTQAALRFLRVDEPDLTEIHEILEDIAHDNRRTTEIMRRLRGLLKKEPVAPEPVDMNEAVSEMAGLLHSDSVLQQVGVQLELDERLPRVEADPVQIRQVLLNLMRNAFDALQEGPAEDRQLVVRTVPDAGGGVQVSVEDSGPGIGDRDPESLFRAFETEKPTGLGMGLSIARTIVEAHGGRIWAQNNVGRGATFSFTLPATQAQ